MLMLSDTELVRRFQKGDSTAFAEFSERHRGGLYRMAYAWTGDAMLAEDAVQEAFYRSYTGLLKFRFRSEPKTWLVRVCRNISRELVRKHGREVHVEQSQLPESGNEAEAPRLSDRHPSAVNIVSHLPPMQREVLVLRLFEEYPIKDVARILRIREGTVKAHYAKATANLKRLAEEYGVTND